MPITRRRRANPPEQPENNNNNNHLAEGTEQSAETSAAEHSADAVQEQESPTTQQQPASTDLPAQEPLPFQTFIPPPPFTAPAPIANGDRAERVERGINGDRADRPTNGSERGDRQDYPPALEGGRRTARGEFFRRPPQVPPPPQPVSPAVTSAPLQPPSHEISLPLGNLLHLAYNPGYTGADEARSALLQKLVNESKAGGRARCWSCGSLAIVYDRWNTRSKTFGEVGIAICEICGVWSVM